jgi:hypothetical protein
VALRVPLAELDERDEATCAHNPFLAVYYQDAPFTGIGYEEERTGALTEYAYVDGCGHGRCTTTAANGVVVDEFFLAHGHEVGEHRQRYDDGQLCHYTRHGRHRLTRAWSEAGVLIEELDVAAASHLRWYADGGLKWRLIGAVTEVFLPSGASPYRSVPRGATEPIDAGYMFDDALMDAHLEAIIDDPMFEHGAFAWVHGQRRRAPEVGDRALARLLAHPNLWIVTTAMRIVGAGRLVAFAPTIRARLDDDRIPPAQQFEHGGGRSANRSVGTVARAVLAQLGLA